MQFLYVAPVFGSRKGEFVAVEKFRILSADFDSRHYGELRSPAFRYGYTLSLATIARGDLTDFAAFTK